MFVMPRCRWYATPTVLADALQLQLSAVLPQNMDCVENGSIGTIAPTVCISQCLPTPTSTRQLPRINLLMGSGSGSMMVIEYGGLPCVSYAVGVAERSRLLDAFGLSGCVTLPKMTKGVILAGTATVVLTP